LAIQELRREKMPVPRRQTTRDGLAIERESYFNPGPLIAAVMRTPRVWAPFLRLRLSGLVNHLRTRRKP